MLFSDMEYRKRIPCILRDTLILFALLNTGICNSVSAEQNLHNTTSYIPKQIPTAEGNVSNGQETESRELIGSESLENDIISSESVAVNRLTNYRDNSDGISASYDPKIEVEFESASPEEEPEGPPDHVIPYSEHEEAKDVATKPKYGVPGEWAKPPAEKNVPLDFVPTKLYAQVRGTHTVKTLPRREAVTSAKNDEEKNSAPRLREVVTNSKVNTVYTEEGYEDAAYDHAGHIRDADFHEGFARKLHEDIDSSRKFNHGNDKEKYIDRARKRKDEAGNEEFEEYGDDYIDHIEESANREENVKIPVNENPYQRNYEKGRNVLLQRDIDPRVLVEGGIEKLEDDLQKEAAESAKGSELHRSVKLHSTEDEDNDKYEEKENRSSSLAEFDRDYDDEKGTNRFDVTATKKKKSKSGRKSLSINRGDVEASELRTKESNRQDSKQRANKQSYETDTVPFQTVPINGKVNDKTTKLRDVTESLLPKEQKSSSYNSPVADLQGNQDSTTANYGTIFWDFFKIRDNERTTIPAPTFVEEATKVQVEQQTPGPLTTTHKNQPYFLGIQRETTTEPSVFLSPRAYVSQTLPSVLDPRFRKDSNDNRVASEQTADWNAIANGKEFLDTPTAAAYTNFQTTSTHFDAYESWTTLPVLPVNDPPEDLISRSGTVDSETDSLEDAEGNSKFQENPFLNPLVRDAYANAMNRSKSRYKILVRHLPKKLAKRIEKSKEQLKNSEPSDSVDKTNFDSSIWGGDSTRGNMDFLSTEGDSYLGDLDMTRPPTVNEQSAEVTYSDFLPYHSRGKSTDRPSVSLESETTREQGQRKLPVSFDRHRARPHKLTVGPSPGREHSYVVGQTPRLLFHVRNFFPPTMLRPPPPPFGFRPDRAPYKNNGLVGGYQIPSHRGFDRYKKYIRTRRSVAIARGSARNGGKTRGKRNSRWNDSVSTVGGKNLSKGAVRRSESETANVDKEDEDNGEILNVSKSAKINSAVNNGPTVWENEKKIQRFAVREARPVATRLKNYRKTEEELLNEAPQIADDVIDEELKTRFNNDEQDNNDNERNVEVEVPDFAFADDIFEEDHAENVQENSTKTRVDTEKYPFYKNEKIPNSSVLKYIVDPRRIPRKSFGGMEFYNSRNSYKECEEVDPNLDEVLPEEEEPVDDRGLKEDLPRLRGLGTKIDCFKAKFFDENPLDNPLFLEDQVDDPQLPAELNLREFQARILAFPRANEKYITQKNSKKPERSNSLNYKHGTQEKKIRNGYFHSPRQSPKGNRDNGRGLRYQKSRRQKQKPGKSKKTIPYQKLVYDDVMGNIRNSANAYGNYPKFKAQSGRKFGVNAANNKNKNTEPPLIAITDKLQDNFINVKSPYPPLYKYKLIEIPYRQVSSHQTFPSNSRLVSQLKRIRIQKRQAENAGTNFRLQQDIEKKIHSIIKRSAENVTQVDNGTDSITEKSNAVLETLSIDILSTTAKPVRTINANTKDNVTVLKSKDVDDDKKSDSSQRIVYTIRDRIRHSKPRAELDRIGKFTRNETIANKNSRRNEPTYNNVRNRRLQRKTSTIDSNKTNEETLNSTVNSNNTITSASTIIIEHKLPHQQNAQNSMQYATRHRKNNENYTEISENQTVIPSTQNYDALNTELVTTEAKTEKNYAVHENVQEDVTTTTANTVEPTTSDQFARIKAYLESDPPGFAETFPEDMGKTLNVSDSEEVTTSETNSQGKSEEEEGQKNEKNMGKNEFESSEHSSSGEESIERDEETEKSPSKVSTRKEDDSGSLMDVKSSEEDEPFFRYTGRPYSPAENYEDLRYMDLGPRVNKPAFHHPPFPVPDYERYRERKDKDKWIASEEKDGKDRYIFPWERDKGEEDLEDRAESKFHSYEYPWERRERLAKEQKRRKRKHGFFSTEDDDDDDEDVFFMRKRRKHVYPWDRYDVPSVDHINSKSGKNAFDTDGLSSENQRVTKHSGDYKDKEKVPFEKDLPKKFEETDGAAIMDDIDEKLLSSKDNDYRPIFADSKLDMSLDPEVTVSSPNRKSRRQMTQIEKTASYELISESMEEPDAKKLTRKKMIKKSTKKRNKNNFEDDENEDVTTQSPQSTTISSKVINPTVKFIRKQRKRKIPTTRSSVNSTEQSTVRFTTESSKIERQKILTTTSKPTSTGPSKVVRRRQQTSENSKKKRTTTTPSSSLIDEAEVQDSTPPGKTVEHRSSVSKEKIIRKTVYPNDERAFSTENRKNRARNRSSTTSTETNRNPQPTESRKNENLKNSEHGNTAKNESTEKISIVTKKTPGRVYRSKEIDKDGVKGTYITITPINGTSHENSSEIFDVNGKQSRQVETLERTNSIDRIDHAEPILTAESYVMGNLLQNLATTTAGNNPQRESLKIEESDEDEESIEREKRRILLGARVVKDPQRRLYYYVETR